MIWADLQRLPRALTRCSLGKPSGTHRRTHRHTQTHKHTHTHTREREREREKVWLHAFPSCPIRMIVLMRWHAGRRPPHTHHIEWESKTRESERASRSIRLFSCVIAYQNRSLANHNRLAEHLQSGSCHLYFSFGKPSFTYIYICIMYLNMYKYVIIPSSAG